jgi:hypothetical protein
VTTFYTLDRANARLRDVRPILEDLRARRGELVGLRDRLHAASLRDRLHAASLAEVPNGSSGSLVDDALTDAAGAGGLESGRVLAARIQAVIDQMQAAVERLDAWDVTLRDIETGLVDFPALVSGRGSGSAGAWARAMSPGGTSSRPASPAGARWRSSREGTRR